MKFSTIWGFRPNVRHIRAAVARDTPDRAAMVLVDQWVDESDVVVVVVSLMISAISSS